jgi:hypothetical protein
VRRGDESGTGFGNGDRLWAGWMLDIEMRHGDLMFKWGLPESRLKALCRFHKLTTPRGHLARVEKGGLVCTLIQWLPY